MDARSERIARAFEPIVLVAALLVIPVIAVEQSDLREPWPTVAAVTNWLIWLVFLAELVVMLAVAHDRTRWLREHPLDVALVVLTPPFMPSSLQAFRALRLLRLLRLLRALRIARRLFSLEGLRYAAVLAALTALGGGAAFAAAEGERLSTWDGVWWSVTTMTTVGYGDITPETLLGRTVAIATMLVGIGFVAILTAALAQRFVAQEVREEAAETEAGVVREIESAEAEIGAELRAIAQRLHELERRLGSP